MVHSATTREVGVTWDQHDCFCEGGCGSGRQAEAGLDKVLPVGCALNCLLRASAPFINCRAQLPLIDCPQLQEGPLN